MPASEPTVGFREDSHDPFPSTGLPVAPVAVTRMVAVRADELAFAVKLQLMVPELVPLSPYVIESHLLAGVTAADQSMVPVPVLETLNVVVPASLATARLAGLTDRIDSILGILTIKWLAW